MGGKEGREQNTKGGFRKGGVQKGKQKLIERWKKRSEGGLKGRKSKGSVQQEKRGGMSKVKKELGEEMMEEGGQDGLRRSKRSRQRDERSKMVQSWR